MLRLGSRPVEPPHGATRPVRRARRANWYGAALSGRAAVPWLFLTPALLLFLYFKIVPIVQAMKMSLFQVRPYLGDRWIGADNYAEVISGDQFTTAIWHTVVLAVGTTVGSIVVGLVLALLLEGPSRHLWIVRTAVFLPVVTAMAVVAEVWRIIYYPAPDGTLNTLLSLVGLGPASFLDSPHTSLVSVLGVGVWRGAPYDMMIFIAGLMSVDRSLYEAAAIDGAGVWRRVRHVTLPALRPVFTILLILAAIRGLRVFTEIYVLTNGGPSGSTEVLMTLIYKLGLERGELGVAAAGSVVLFAATLVLTLAVRLIQRRASR